MKTLRLYGVGLLVALLLALVTSSASGQGAGGSGGGGSGTTVTVKQYGSGPSVVYYRVGSGNWRPLILSAGRGTFTANGEYEVAARCDSENTLSLFKASTAYRTQVPFSCPPGPKGRSVRFTITLPSSVGGVSPESDDLVAVGSKLEIYEGIDPITVNAEGLLTSAGGIVITLFRPSISTSAVSHTPYGYKVVSLGADDTSVLVDSRGWEAISPTNTRSFSVSAPEGFASTALVFHTRNGYLSMATVGGAIVESGASVTGKYGLLPWDGVYVGYYEAVSSESSGDALKAFRDTGGGDWKPTLPAPWTSGQFSVNGDTLYRIPVVPGLDYRLIGNPSAVNFSLKAFIRDRNLEFLYSFGPPSEAQAQGVDLAMAEREGAYFGSRYTLP